MLNRINLKSLNIFTVFVSMIIFTLLWWCMVLIPSVTPYDDTFKRFGLTALLILISKYFDKDLKIKLSETYGKLDFKNLVCSFTGIFIYLFLVSCLYSQKICSFNFLTRDFRGYISLFFLALFEEMLFRGWGYTASWSAFNKYKTNLREVKLLNKFSITLSELKAIILTNLFFAIIHLQTFIMIYHYDFLQTSNEFIQVFIVGVFFTLLFRKTRSIWNVVLVHAFWDWLLGVIVR